MNSSTDWSKVEFFDKNEFEYPDRLDPLLIYSLDALRKAAGKPIKINCDFRPGDDKQHGIGKAADIVIKGLSVVDQFLIAEKTRLFSGIGLYPFSNTPGIHIDIRTLQPHEPGARWARNAAGVYVELNWKFIRSIQS